MTSHEILVRNFEALDTFSTYEMYQDMMQGLTHPDAFGPWREWGWSRAMEFEDKFKHKIDHPFSMIEDVFISLHEHYHSHLTIADMHRGNDSAHLEGWKREVQEEQKPPEKVEQQSKEEQPQSKDGKIDKEKEVDKARSEYFKHLECYACCKTGHIARF